MNKIRVLVSTVALLALSSCGESGLLGDCGYEITSSSVSNLGTYTVSQVHQNCGATTGYSTGVFIHYSDVGFDPESTHLLFAMHGRQSVPVRWTSDTEVRISVRPQDANNMNCEWGRVEITCSNK